MDALNWTIAKLSFVSAKLHKAATECHFAFLFHTVRRSEFINRSIIWAVHFTWPPISVRSFIIWYFETNFHCLFYLFNLVLPFSTLFGREWIVDWLRTLTI